MEIIYIDHTDQHIEIEPSSVAFGNFDGLHIGHQRVVERAKELAERNQLKSGVMTFHPHPKEVLGRVEKATYLTPLEDKLELLSEIGIDYVLVVKFTKEFAAQSPEEFIQQYIERLGIQHVVTGFDFCFGSKGSGTVETLRDRSKSGKKFQLHVIPSIDDNHQKISSSRIRECISLGQVDEAAVLLNRPFQINGKVIHGEKRGRLLGFPTANVQVYDSYLLPRMGVYAVQVIWGSATYPGVLNIGRKPTFHHDAGEITLEVHLLDFNQNLYDERLTIQFMSYLRSEKNFNSVEELKHQIQLDIIAAKGKLFS